MPERGLRSRDSPDRANDIREMLLARSAKPRSPDRAIDIREMQLARSAKPRSPDRANDIKEMLLARSANPVFANRELCTYARAPRHDEPPQPVIVTHGRRGAADEVQDDVRERDQIVVWRFTGRRTLSVTSERRAQKWVAASFFLLGPYFVVEAVRKLIDGADTQVSVLAVALTGSAIVLMALLGRAKLRLGKELDSGTTRR